MSVTKLGAEFLQRTDTGLNIHLSPPLPYYLTLACTKNPPSRPPRSAFSTPSIPRQPEESESNEAFQFLPQRSFPSLLFLLPSRHLSTSFRSQSPHPSTLIGGQESTEPFFFCRSRSKRRGRGRGSARVLSTGQPRRQIIETKKKSRGGESRESCYLHMDGQARTSRGTERGESGRMAGRQQLSAFLFSITHTHTQLKWN